MIYRIGSEGLEGSGSVSISGNRWSLADDGYLVYEGGLSGAIKLAIDIEDAHNPDGGVQVYEGVRDGWGDPVLPAAILYRQVWDTDDPDDYWESLCDEHGHSVVSYQVDKNGDLEAVIHLDCPLPATGGMRDDNA